MILKFVLQFSVEDTYTLYETERLMARGVREGLFCSAFVVLLWTISTNIFRWRFKPHYSCGNLREKEH